MPADKSAPCKISTLVSNADFLNQHEFIVLGRGKKGFALYCLRLGCSSARREDTDAPMNRNPFDSIAHPNSRGAHVYKSVFGRILICSMSLAISSLVMLAQDAGFKSAKTDNHPESLQILTPHQGVDFTGFSPDLVRAIKQNWWAKMPSETKQKLDRGLKGRVVVGICT
jgi:hypothetical protein